MYGLSSSAISDTLGHLQDLQRHWVIRLAELLLVFDLCMK